MLDAQTRRLILPDDRLYRKVQPDQWDADGPHPMAFRDKYKDLSLFVARIALPHEILARFARYPAVMRACGTGNRAPTPAEMYDSAYRVAVIPYSIIAATGFQVQIDPGGHQFREDGHANLVDGGKLAITWARNARLLDRTETLG